MSKTNLVLLPGLANTAELWKHQCEHLADHANILIPDMSKDDSLAAMAAQVLDNVTGPFVVCGISMGGYLAFEIIRRAAVRVDKLVLFDTTAKADTLEKKHGRAQAIKKAQAGGYAALLDGLFNTLVYEKNRSNPGLKELFLKMGSETGAKGYARQQKAMTMRLTNEPLLKKIACPVLVACGCYDTVTPPAEMAQLAKDLPNGKFVTIDNSGHLPPVEQPEAVTSLLQLWLQI